MSEPLELSVDDPHGQRFEVALELLREGRPISYRGIHIFLRDPELVECGVITKWAPADITEEIARGEMLSGKDTIDALVAENSSFAEIVSGRDMRFSLISWDGMAYTEFYRMDGKV